MATKQTAREKMLAFVVEHGWTLDPAKQIPKDRWSSERKQDPHSFVKPAAHGGTWHVSLDYTNRSGGGWYNTIGNLLNYVEVSYRNAAGELEPPTSWSHQGNIGTLRNTDRSSYRSDSHLWKALGPKRWMEKPPSISDRARLLFTDPDYAIWLGKEAEHEYDTARQAERDANEAERKLRERPLPITVDRSEWQRLSRKVKYAADAVEQAHGNSDLHALVADLIVATAAVMSVIEEKVEVQA